MKKPATGYKFKVFVKVLVFAEFLSKLLKSQTNGGREKVVKNETHG